jgi:hypothetical protein
MDLSKTNPTAIWGKKSLSLGITGLSSYLEPEQESVYQSLR